MARLLSFVVRLSSPQARQRRHDRCSRAAGERKRNGKAYPPGRLEPGHTGAGADSP